MPIRVAVADDHPLTLDALEALFSEEPDITVVASCRTGEDALAAVHTHAVDVLVLDLRMPGMDGLAVLRAMAGTGDTTAVAVYTGGLDGAELVEAVRLGARGVILKEMRPNVLIECVRALHGGVRWFESGVSLRSLRPSADGADITPAPSA